MRTRYVIAAAVVTAGVVIAHPVPAPAQQPASRIYVSLCPRPVDDSVCATREGSFETQGSTELFALDPAGLQRTQLTNNRFHEQDVVWSPDRSRIVYTRGKTTSTCDQDNGLESVDVDGSDPRKLTALRPRRYGCHVASDWSSDGRIVYRSRHVVRACSDLYSISSRGGDRVRLTHNCVRGRHNHAWDARWTHNSRRVLFIRNAAGDGPWEIQLTDADGIRQRTVTRNRIGEEELELAPDGRTIAFIADFRMSETIFAIDIGGAGQPPLTADALQKDQLEWSPDGTKLIFRGVDANGSHLYYVDLHGPGGDPTTTRIDSAELRAVSTHELDPHWSPDGTEIAFIGYVEDAGAAPFVMEADGTNVRRLAPYQERARVWGWETLPTG